MSGYHKIHDGTDWIVVDPGNTLPTTPVARSYTRISGSDRGYQYTSVTAPTAVNTKSAWTQIVASSPATDMDEIHLYFYNFGNSGRSNSGYLEIGIGASGSEISLIDGINLNYCGSTRPQFIRIPIRVPANSRVAVRWQTAAAAYPTGLVSIGFGSYPAGPLTSPSSVDVIGKNAATSLGVAMTTGSITQVISSTTQDYRGVVVTLSSNDNALVTENIGLNLCVGVSGSEVIYPLPGFWLVSSTELIEPISTEGNYIPLPISMGTRLAVRVDAANVANTGFNVILLGVPA